MVYYIEMVLCERVVSGINNKQIVCWLLELTEKKNAKMFVLRVICLNNLQKFSLPSADHQVIHYRTHNIVVDYYMITW